MHYYVTSSHPRGVAHVLMARIDLYRSSSIKNTLFPTIIGEQTWGIVTALTATG